MTATLAEDRVSTDAASVTRLVKTYGRGDSTVPALADVTLRIERGRFTAIMGPSGSGKSTLLHCMAGLDSATSGEVRIGDEDVTRMSEAERTRLRRDRLGFVFQAYNLVPTLTAEENILLPSRLARRRPDPGFYREVVSTLGIADRLGHRPAQMSGGQQQRVAMARALVGRPAVVFADEPTGALDSRSSGAVLGFLVHAVHEMGQTIVMVTHDPLAASRADRVVFLADGYIVGDMFDPTPDRILDTMKSLGG
ncbi:MAG: ABC transporter ATP-binding protein [Acidimicrobiia bacterium]|nr:ABC transporter ATP-binding protein [Acidimicrobiia bacterium]